MVFLSAITQIGLLAFGLTSEAFVNINAHPITEDISQSLRCSSLTYRCNRTLTIRRIKTGHISERCNVSDGICVSELRRKNGMKIKFKLHCRWCSKTEPISITIRQNASGVIRTKACVYEKHCETRQEAFVNIKAQIKEDICQSLRCSSLTYRCNRTLTSPYDSKSFSVTIQRSKKVSNSSDCKVALILNRDPCKMGPISERCNVSYGICVTVLRSKNGMEIKFKLHCRWCSKTEPISITIRQNASGVIRTKACVYEKHCETRQDMVCTYKYSKEENDQDQGLKPRLIDEKGKDRETTRHITTIFCFVMLCLLLEILACVVLYIWMRNKHWQPATPEIENSFGIPSDDEPGQLSPNSPQSPGTNNRAPRVIANNDHPSEERDKSREMDSAVEPARYRSLCQNRNLGMSDGRYITNGDQELGRIVKNEEPLYWVLEGSGPSEEGPRSSGEPSTSLLSSGIPSDDEPGRLSPNSPQSPGTNREIFQALLPNNRAPRVIANNDDPSEERDESREMDSAVEPARYRGLCQNRNLGMSDGRYITNGDQELGRIDKNEEPLYWVLEGPGPSEEGPRSSGEPSSFSRIHQDPLRGVTEELPVQNMNTCKESLYGVVEIPIGVTERLYKEQEAGNTDDQPDSALSRGAAIGTFIMSLKHKVRPKPKAKVEA
ncbi:uncharacterized protein [Montipora capricornis]|uniref:uncharacterized protein isoform X2 n=1 Tax=Montipora capricornis TaxID=246305 RepID=UPI0035F10B43